MHADVDGPQETHPVVIIDDVPEIREIIGFLVEESGWFKVVGEAPTAEEALPVIERTSPRLILLDLEPTGGRGVETLQLLRERFPATSIVVLSSVIDDVESVRSQIEAFASAVIDKGTSNRLLIPKLLEVLGAGSGVDEVPGIDARGVRAPAISESEAGAWLTAIVNAAPDAIIGFTVEGTVVSWNPAAELLYGYKAGEVVGRPLGLLVPADRRDEVDRILDTVRRGRGLRGYETVRVHKDGTRIDVHLALTPVIDSDGAVVGGSTIARDVTARRHTEVVLGRAITQLDRRNRELVRSNEELDSFAAVASHDLAQPLQVAYGFLDMLRTDFGDQLPEQGQQWLGNSLSSLERMRDLVRDILRYARSGAGTLTPKRVDLSDVVGDALGALAVTLEERQARVEVATPLPTVTGDAGQLTLVLQNLIANGVKFVPPDRIPLIRVTGQVRDGHALVCVADNGIGVPAEERLRVFEMFQRATGSGFKGSGLGLAIVKKLVVRHGGNVWIEEAAGGGTAVWLRLPAAPVRDRT